MLLVFANARTYNAEDSQVRRLVGLRRFLCAPPTKSERQS